MHNITFVQNENMSVAEAKALEEAIQLSLTESSRRASRGESFYGGFGAGGNDCDSGYTSLAASSKSHWAEVCCVLSAVRLRFYILTLCDVRSRTGLETPTMQRPRRTSLHCRPR
jgi:hypothetical protein